MDSIEAAWEHRDRVPLSDLLGLEDPNKRSETLSVAAPPGQACADGPHPEGSD